MTTYYNFQFEAVLPEHFAKYEGIKYPTPIVDDSDYQKAFAVFEFVSNSAGEPLKVSHISNHLRRDLAVKKAKSIKVLTPISGEKIEYLPVELRMRPRLQTYFIGSDTYEAGWTSYGDASNLVVFDTGHWTPEMWNYLRSVNPTKQKERAIHYQSAIHNFIVRERWIPEVRATKEISACEICHLTPAELNL